MVRRQAFNNPRPHPRVRIRELLPNLLLGDHLPGPLNSITDVPGIEVSTQELTSRDGSVNTGVTCIVPRKDWFHKACYASFFSFNGYGEITGCHYIAENGLLCSPVILTGTSGIGAAHQGVVEYGVETVGRGFMALPVIAETFNGYLHDCATFAVKPKHIVEGLKNARADVPLKKATTEVEMV